MRFVFSNIRKIGASLGFHVGLKEGPHAGRHGVGCWQAQVVLDKRSPRCDQTVPQLRPSRVENILTNAGVRIASNVRQRSRGGH